MTRVADMSDLPRRRDSDDGWAPDPTPRFGQLLVEAWHEAATDVPLARPEARFRHSDAGTCSRAVAYAALGVEPSDPIDGPGTFITTQGHIIHEAFQAALQARYPAAQVEVKVGEGDFAGHIDAVIDLMEADSGPRKVAVEAKSQGGYAYKLALGVPPAAQRPEGPKWDHVVQASLNALAIDADQAVVIYFARDAISKQMADRVGNDLFRVVAEWTLTREQFEPIAIQERERITAILALVDEGTLPARKIPDPELPARHLVVNAARGEWMSYDAKGVLEDKGVTWRCSYCRYQARCAGTPGRRTPVADVADVLGLEA